VVVSGEETAFAWEGTDRPESVSMDPGYHLFRRLYPSEIPPSVNAIRGVARLWVVLAADGGETARQAAEMLIQALGLPEARIVEEDRLPGDAENLLIVGVPRNSKLLAGLPTGVQADSDGFHLAGQRFDQGGDALFVVFRSVVGPKAVRAIFAYRSPEAAAAAVRKIPHYGRYGYLAFSNGRNRVKGIWPVTESPLIVPLKAP
jgi:hypothetical protein